MTLYRVAGYFWPKKYLKRHSNGSCELQEAQDPENGILQKSNCRISLIRYLFMIKAQLRLFRLMFDQDTVSAVLLKA
jgi:hypothetical protein